MAVFHYKARDARGGLLEGEIEAGTAEAASVQLASSGAIPIEISERALTANPFPALLARLTREKPTLTDLLLFSRQMYTLMKAGVPINRAMAGLVESLRNRVLVDALRDVLSNLESGRGLAASLGRHAEIFPTLFVSIVRVGEETGRLDEAFMRVAGYLELEKETRERIKTALRYPVMVILAIGVAVAIINIFVIPAFAQLFAKSGVDLPWQTQLLIDISNFFVSGWPYMLAVLIGTVFGVRIYVKTPRGRYQWDRAKLRLPLVGGILHRATLGRFARAFSMSLSSGVPLIQALTVVSRAVDNEYVAEHILGMRTGIERGETITRTAGATKLFTPLVLQMTAVGEETGAVDDLMGEVAEYYEREVDYDVRNLSAIIEPVMVVAIGLMVLVLALGVFLPMWDLSTAMAR